LRACGFMRSFIPFGWSLFLKVSIWELNCYKWEDITGNVKVLFWNWRHCTHGRWEFSQKLVAPWSHPGSKTKEERWAHEESHAENKVCCPGMSHQHLVVLLEGPRLLKSSLTLLILMSSSEKFACNVREQLFLYWLDGEEPFWMDLVTIPLTQVFPFESLN